MAAALALMSLGSAGCAGAHPNGPPAPSSPSLDVWPIGEAIDCPRPPNDDTVFDVRQIAVIALGSTGIEGASCFEEGTWLVDGAPTVVARRGALIIVVLDLQAGGQRAAGVLCSTPDRCTAVQPPGSGSE